MSEFKQGPGLLGPVPNLDEVARVAQPTLIGLVLTENNRLQQELRQQYLIRAVTEYKLRPKKRGRKPKPKTEIDKTPKKPGRPNKFTDKTRELMIELVDTLKEQYGFKTDQDALRHFLEVNCVELGRFKSMREARRQLNSLKIQLCRARKKKANH